MYKCCHSISEFVLFYSLLLVKKKESKMDFIIFLLKLNVRGYSVLFVLDTNLYRFSIKLFKSILYIYVVYLHILNESRIEIQ